MGTSAVTSIESSGSSEVVRKQIRGGGLLVAGRVLSLGLTTLAQVLIVRHLSTRDYGAWAYALAAVLFWQTISNLGFHEAITRFVPIFHHRRDYARMLGTMVLCFGLVLLSGTLVVAAFYAWPEKVLALVRQPGASLNIVFILIFLVPVDAADTLLMGLFASLVSPRAIFFRRHVVAPGLKLAVVLLLIVFKRGVLFLAYGYLAASVVGVLLYGFILVRQLRRDGLFAKSSLHGIHIPAREVFSYTVPLMTSDLVVMLIQSVVVLLLGYYHGMQDVAFYRVVVPAAAMNQTVTLTSALLYLPAAARMFAADDRQGLQQLYWRTAAWAAVLSFPIFIATFGFSRPLTVMLYGPRYADSGLLLAVLAFGYYYDVMFGFNGLTLKAMNKVGYIVTCNAGAAVVNIVLSLLLIPRYGALGAAVATAGTMVFLATAKQIALRVGVGIKIFDRQSGSLYLAVVAAVLALLAIRLLVTAHLVTAAMLSAFILLALFAAVRAQLNIAEVFPETAHVPLIRRLFNARAA